MFGIALTGPLGVGKTTIARALLRDAPSMVMLSSLTTRAVESDELGCIHVGSTQFLTRCKSGEIVLPHFFAGHWYGYDRITWTTAIASGGAGYIFNVRPYLGLVLEATLPNVRAAWLRVPRSVRKERINSRNAERDRSEMRVLLDEADEHYEAVYSRFIDAVDTEVAVAQLRALIADTNE